ncbi:hypothetical protein MP228_009144 [Amoeboaphelidium protococcarum]|nr:hypothetical protein MP228_009144 [Amoeboaphelidium protococcarum]
MPKKLNIGVRLQSSSSNNNKRKSKISAKQRWEMLRHFVERGQYKQSFLKDVQMTTLSRRGAGAGGVAGRQYGQLTLPKHFELDDDDSASDKLSKIVAQQVLKIRHSRQMSQQQQPQLPSQVKSMTAEEIEQIRKDEQAYMVALGCVLFPLLDHKDVSASMDSLDGYTSSNQQSSESVGGAYQSLVASIAKKFSFGSSGSNGDQKSRQYSADSKLTSVFVKELKEAAKSWLKENASSGQEDSSSFVDRIYFHALLQFYEQVIKKNQSQIVSAGTTYADLINIFDLRVRKEIEQLIAEAPADESRILTPFANKSEAAFARVQLFVDLVKACIEDLQVQELSQSSRKNRRHSRMPSTAQSGGKANHKRTKSKTNESSSGSSGKKDNTENGAIAEVDEVESFDTQLLTQSSVVMAELLKDVFIIKRNQHEKYLHSITTSEEAELMVDDFNQKLRSLDNRDMSGSKFYQFEVENLCDNEPVFYYWRKLEKKDLGRFISRLDKLYIHPDQGQADVPVQSEVIAPQEDKTQSQGMQQIRIRVIEAKNLAAKNEDVQSSDPYVAVEWGKERYETSVVQGSLFPLWDQEVQLEVKAQTKKPLKITVWDKDEEGPSVLSAKFWKDEADDFLGQVVFEVPQLLTELQKCQGRFFKKWYPLQKRSSRSHVSGEIHLLIELVSDSNQAAQQNQDVQPAESRIRGLSKSSLDIAGSIIPQLSREDAHNVYLHLLVKLIGNDCNTNNSLVNSGECLSRVSKAILQEIAAKYRLQPAWCELALTQTLVKFATSNQGDFAQINQFAAIGVLVQQQPKFEKILQDGYDCWSSVKVMAPANESADAAGNLIFNPPVVSGVGGYLSFNLYRLQYNIMRNDLLQYCSEQIQHYKDCFPMNTPTGALVNTLLLMNSLYESSFKGTGVSDSGLGVNEGVKSSQEFSGSVTLYDTLNTLLKSGTLERFMRISEMSNPVKEDPVGRLVKLAAMIIEEIDSDKLYFEEPFAADINIVCLTSGIYLKYYTLEMENFTAQMQPAVKQSKKQADLLEHGTNIFELFYAVKDLQEKVLINLRNSQDQSDRDLADTFNLHRWLAPGIHSWLIHSEGKLLQWVESSVAADRFESLSGDSGLLHSTSVIDLFFCLNQMIECLNKLDWIQAGGSITDDENGDSSDDDGEITMRTMHWNLFLTRYARVLNRGVAKYGEILSGQVMQERLQYVKAAGGKGNDNLDVALSGLLSPSKKLANASVKSLNNQVEWLAGTKATQQLCVKVNNIEAARVQLNETYSQLKVDAVSDWMKAHSKVKQSDRQRDSIKEASLAGGLSGQIVIKVVGAENLMPCDANGQSDPYCVITVKERNISDQQRASSLNGSVGGVNPWQKTSGGDYVDRVIAKTKIQFATLNARWNEEFSTILRYATEFTVTVFDHDTFGRDDVCGYHVLKVDALKDSLADGFVHDVWINISPQGKVLLRMQLDKSQSISSQSGLADIDFYFRKSFRELKRFSYDLLGLFSESMGVVVKKELVKILKDCEKSGVQGAGEILGGFRSLFSAAGGGGGGGSSSSPSSHNAADKALASFSDKDLVSVQEVDSAMTPLTDYLNETLSVLSQNLYPRLSKDLLRKTWKELLYIFESLMLPSLYGEAVLISPLNRAKPLTQKQVEMLTKCLDILKMFFHADGSELGVPMNVLESKMYKELVMCCEFYWKDYVQIVKKFDEVFNQQCLPGTSQLSAQQQQQQYLDSDGLLKLLRLRSFDKYTAEMFKLRFKERESRKRLDEHDVNRLVNVDN